MKRLLYLLIMVIFIGTLVVSCKSHEKCPAYSKADSEHTDDNA